MTTPMLPSRPLPLLLIVWTLLVGQSNAVLQLSEQLHQLGHSTSFNAVSAKKHQQGHCLADLLLNHCGLAAVAIVVAQVIVKLHSFRLATALHCLLQRTVVATSIRAPPRCRLL
ncbi:hypothetical protein [Ferrimonas lipolytica]|uniref:Uncharacterized protein n=1 Tax=Ferrimonas lipolytica TaxID=2724191 RepID=A0A6H1UFU8_9GAMM|nr:hypothetical protein [Ferrimonas lipolytica]QIZ77698.1 hypothetical protein HER31_12795 [Ferrimonas lipolytica]